MKEFPLTPYLVSIYSLVLVNVIVITEGELDAASCYEAMENWPMVSLPHGAASAKKRIFRNKYLYYKAMRRSYYSSTMTMPEEELSNRQRPYSRSVRSRLRDWSNTKMRQMRSKPMTRKLLGGLSGMRSRINRMASLVRNLY